MQTAAYDNVVIGNRLIGNGQPGVAMHAHKAGAILTGNLVTGNYIAYNGADVADNATPGPTGINIDGGASGVSLNGNTVTGNVIEHEAVDIAVRTEASTQIDIHLNDLLGEGSVSPIRAAARSMRRKITGAAPAGRTLPAARRSRAT